MLRLLPCFLFLLLAACGGGAALVGVTPDESLPARQQEAYRLGSQDQIRLIVFGEDELSGEYVVNGTGVVSLPLIGEIEAAGLTLQELQRNIEAEFAKGYLVEPRVSAEVINFRPFYIIGEVNSPGEYPYSDGLTVVNAVATAGGYTYRADQRRVFISREDGADWQQFRLDSQTLVQPGDTIRIGERFF